MSFCNISPIILNKNPCKILSNNSQKSGSSYTQNSINKESLILYLFELGFTPCKVQQTPQGMDLQE